MLTQADRKASDSQSNRRQTNFALELPGNENRLDSTYVPVTTSSSRHPSINLPAQEFSLPPTIQQQTSHDFSLPVRGRHESQIQNGRSSITAFGNFSGAAPHLTTPESGSWYSQEGYQQAAAQFQARRSRSQPPRSGPGTSYSHQQQPFEAPGTMRYVNFSVDRVLLLRSTKAPSPQFYHLLRRISDHPPIFSHLQFTRLL